MNRFKRLLTLTVLLAISLNTVQPALADSVTAPGTVSSSAVLTTDATLLSVTVPTSVLIYVNAAGEVITPSSVPITNNSAAPVVVTSLAVNTENGWTLDPSTTDYTKFKVGLKNFSLQINAKDPSAGAIAFDAPINGSESLNLVLSAGVAPQITAITASQIGNMVVTVDWAGTGYVLATDADFSGEGDGGYIYIGTAEYVTIPDTIKGIPVTSYRYMFSNTAVKAVKSTNPNITSFQSMFSNSTATTLELDLNTSGVDTMASMFNNAAAESINFGTTWNTQNVTTLDSMFMGTKVQNLDLSTWNTSSVTSMIGTFQAATSSTINLSNWDTSNVVYLNNLFRDSKTLVLDLSSFDTTNASWLDYTFRGAAVQTVYVRTQADADKLSTSSDLPIGLTFTVK